MIGSKLHKFNRRRYMHIHFNLIYKRVDANLDITVLASVLLSPDKYVILKNSVDPYHLASKPTHKDPHSIPSIPFISCGIRIYLKSGMLTETVATV